MCVLNMCFPSCETSKLRHILRSGLYPKQVIALSSRLWLIRELETRTERVYHEVNRNPGVQPPGGRQLAEAKYTTDTNYRLVLNLAGSVSRDQLENLVKTIIDEYAKKA